MNIRACFRLLILPCCLVGLLATPIQAQNPLKSITNGLKKVGSALNPFKKSVPRKALPAAKPPQPVAKPKSTSSKTRTYSKKKQSYRPRTAKSRSVPKRGLPPQETDAPDNPEGNPADPGKPLPESAIAPAQAAPAASDLPPSRPPETPAPPATAPASAVDTSASATPPKPEAPREIPFGLPILGRPGYARSPYAKDAGEVDVIGIAAGSKVKCPYTGKIFRVP